MPLFKKNKKKIEPPKKQKDKKIKSKKKNIGFRKNKQKKQTKKSFFKKNNKQTEEKLPLEEENERKDEKENNKNKKFRPVKKPLIKKDLKDKPVYLEDTGEKLGLVFDTIYDKDDNLVGFKIKDDKSDNVLSFPADQFEQSKDGLIFIPGWYNQALKTIEKLEFKDKISPELTAVLTDDAVTNEEIYDIFVKYDDDMADFIDDARSIRKMLTKRLNVLEKQRLTTKNDLMDLTEKRLIKDIDRKEFSEDVMKHRRKVNILDLNINKCKELLKRLNQTSFGMLGKENTSYNISEEKINNNLYDRILEKKPMSTPGQSVRETNPVQNDYKKRYLDLKNRYEQLEEDYQELKIAVDKLFKRNEL